MPKKPLSAHRDWGQAMLGRIRAFARDIKGATAVEYGLIVALIFIAVTAAIGNAAGATINMWTNIAARVVGA
jgi:pilus assembly protein Flp/PilA